MIRRDVTALAAAVFFCAPTSLFAADAFTSNIPPFSIEQGPHVGFVREIVVEIGKRLGTNVTVVYGKSWPKSQEEAQSRLDTLIFPLARTKAREPQYQWVVKVIDADVAFATAPGRPKVETDAAARALKGIGVRDGSPMVKDLQDRGYTNLVIVKTSAYPRNRSWRKIWVGPVGRSVDPSQPAEDQRPVAPEVPGSLWRAESVG
jgi:ABC-type amino acid transport substrate-binding protein